MIAADTSVLVAAFAAWHERHADARAALGRTSAIVAHSALELYSVLTRLPGETRVRAPLVVAWLEDRFPDGWLSLDPPAQARLPARLSAAGITGGAVYDGLIALTAAGAGATLLSLDRRASDNYRRCGVQVELL